MKRVTVPGLAWTACGIIASLSAGTLALVALNHGGNCCPNVVAAAAGFIYAGVGALIVSRGQRVIGWCSIVAGFSRIMSGSAHASGAWLGEGLAPTGEVERIHMSDLDHDHRRCGVA